MLHGAPGGFGLLGAGCLERLELGFGRAQAALLAHSRQAVVQNGATTRFISPTPISPNKSSLALFSFSAAPRL
jgi:hypothetical protein